VFGFFNITLLRIIRVARTMRIVEHVGWFEGFDSLHILITAICSSFSVLVWSSLIIFSLLVAGALTSHALLQEYMYDGGYTEAQRQAVYKYFGSFTRSFISMFEMTFASHATITRTLMENVNESWAAFFLAYKCIVSLSVMKVISGVFMHETFKVCGENDDLMIIQKKRTTAEYTRKMTKLFERAAGGSGSISRKEFEQVMQDQWIRTWLSAMEINVNNVERLWMLLDDGDGRLTAEALVRGFARLKGGAKSIHVLAHVKEMQAEMVKLKAIGDSVEEVRATLAKMQLNQMPSPYEVSSTTV